MDEWMFQMFLKPQQWFRHMPLQCCLQRRCNTSTASFNYSYIAICFHLYMSLHIYRSWSCPLHSWVVISMSCVSMYPGPSWARSLLSSPSTPWSASSSWRMEPRLVLCWYEKHVMLDSTTGPKQGWPDLLVIYVKFLLTPKLSFFIPFSLCVSKKFRNGLCFK